MPKCAAGHALRHHLGRRDGELTCDGPDDVDCCGGDGVLRPGMKRWSCEQCDFDICEPCAGEAGPTAGGASFGIDATTRALNFEAKYSQQQVAQAMIGEAAFEGSKLGRNDREAYKPKMKPKKPAQPQDTRSAEDLAKATKAADEAAAALMAELDGESTAPARQRKPAGVATAEVSDGAGVAAGGEACKRADAILRLAVAAGELDRLKAALADVGNEASDAALSEARKARDRLKAKAKKAGKKAGAAPATPTPLSKPGAVGGSPTSVLVLEGCD